MKFPEKESRLLFRLFRDWWICREEQKKHLSHFLWDTL